MDIITDTFPSFVTRTGVLVANTEDNEGAWLMGMKKGDMFIQLPWYETDRQENEHIYDLDVSPDHTKLLYFHSILGNTKDLLTEIRVVTANGNQIWSQTIKSGEAWQWFDNERLYDWKINNDGTPIISLWNYLTGEKQQMKANYHGYADILTGKIFIWWINPFARYDATMSRVVYPACDPDCINGYPIILREVNTGKTLVRIVTYDVFGLGPIWLPDNSGFIMAANITIPDPSKQANEIYLISRDGNVKQLTHFTDYYGHVEINPYYSLSPDGRFLAFWIKAQSGPSDISQFAVINIGSEKVTNYCLPSETFRNDLAAEDKGYITKYGDTPIWSPDSSQLFVVGRDPQDRSIRWTVLVDLKNNIATKLGEDGEAVGWMVSP